jgi:hypothetical protein
MLKCISFIISLFLFFPAYALLQFDRGIYELDGYVSIRNKNEAFFIINKDTNGETDFRLSGRKLDLLLTKNNFKAKIRIKILKPIMSIKGQAEYISTIKYLDIADSVQIYHLKKDLKKVDL